MLAAILFLAAHSPADNDSQWEQLKARIEAAPQVVGTFIERRNGCEYWDGEVNGTGDGRDQSIQRKRKKLRCDQIEQDERLLRNEYRKSLAILELLDDTKELGPW